eukprot:661458-Rhodomonas_salina.1
MGSLRLSAAAARRRGIRLGASEGHRSRYLATSIWDNIIMIIGWARASGLPFKFRPGVIEASDKRRYSSNGSDQ